MSHTQLSLFSVSQTHSLTQRHDTTHSLSLSPPSLSFCVRVCVQVYDTRCHAHATLSLSLSALLFSLYYLNSDATGPAAAR